MSCNPVVYLIDDDEVNCFIVESVLKNVYPTCQVIRFPDADAALQAFMITKNETQPLPVFILLDLFEPQKDRWYFVEQYQDLLGHYFTSSAVFILTCSTFPCDIEKAKKYRCIADVLEKPFTKELVKNKLDVFFQNRTQVA